MRREASTRSKRVAERPAPEFMNLQSSLAFLGFLCIFHVIGGVMAGSFFRQLRRGGAWREFSRLVVGVAFGGLPILLGASVFFEPGIPFFVAAEVGAFILAVLGTLFFPDSLADSLGSKQVVQVAVGGVSFAIGLLVAVLSLRQGAFVPVIIGLVFVVVGVVVFVPAFKALLKQ